MADIKSFPNNRDEYIGAEWVMKWLHGRTSGVFGAENNASVSAIHGTMTVSVSDGNGWMANDKGDGIVWWNDSEAESGFPLVLSVDPADGALGRIDRVVVTWETTNYVSLPEISILKGEKSSKPIPPALTNNNLQRQISLAQVSVPAGTISISSDLITDERLNSNVCGIVTDKVSVDTSTMHSQFDALLLYVQRELAELEAGTAVELKKLQFNNTSVPTSSFVPDSTYKDYKYRAAVGLSGVIGTMIPEVVFSLTDAVSGNFAPVSESYNGGVYLYAVDMPKSAITIPTILAWKGNA